MKSRVVTNRVLFVIDVTRAALPTQSLFELARYFPVFDSV